MFPMATAAGGKTTSFPDACKTPTPPGPPVPIPYGNMASLTQANPATCALKVRVSCQAVITLKTMVMMSSGDEAGSVGGMISGMIKGPVRFSKGSLAVMVEGSPAVFQTCPVDANGTNANAKGLHDTPSQAKVFVAR